MNHRLISKARAPKVYVAIYRDRFELHLYRKTSTGRYARYKFLIAVGKIGDATPGGVYYIDAKTRTPAWLIPEHEDYPKELWNTLVPFEDDKNPFDGGFLSISGGQGVGIHGTRFDPKLGTRVSHGCIRIRTQDLLYLYKRIPLGTLVHII